MTTADLAEPGCFVGFVEGGTSAGTAGWEVAAEVRSSTTVGPAGRPSTCLGLTLAALYYGPTPARSDRRCEELLGEETQAASVVANVVRYLGGLSR